MSDQTQQDSNSAAGGASALTAGLGGIMQQELMLEETPRQAELRKAANHWRSQAETASPEGLRKVCLATAASLDREASDGIARCVCCGKPFSRGMFQ